ncbi:hypothetical protein MTF66_05215 [Pseudoalteromonas sp. 2CM39R]|uniref:hypothetical protein n=1 Tax=Pseudoalteromonas sp. 2CM39R TaxID=2929856 RepID=UPI0020C08E33|nr:hypothetical protein [Pseudoalteromonas sp. 2CM39R]MCK8124387.1 hypothetical protein [Pseudoalteromonas sp. 2CM39R]
MRILIFLLALTSAFFVSVSHADEPDMNDLMNPSYEYIGSCMDLSKEISSGGNVGMCQELIEAIVEQSRPGLVFGSSVEVHMQTDTGPFYRIVVAFKNHYSDTDTSRGVYGYFGTKETAPTCPPEGFPLYDIPVNLDNGELMCAKPFDPFNNCPKPTDNDPFVFGTGEQTEKCFNNDDGTQCKIQTDENGGYYIPVSYGSAEPVMCKNVPDKEVDKTSPPEEKPAPEETDPQPEPDELTAINKINENLDAMNKNQIAASDSNDERLDRVAEEIQISNELLGEIRYNTAMTDLNTDLANSLLQGILDKPVGGGGGGSGSGEGDGEEEQPFTIQAKRKNNNKGLNKLFTEQDLQTVTEEITQKRQELKDYVQQIKSESGSLFEVTPSFGGGYEERIVNIKGADVDMGLGRLANFFQLIAAAVLLISTLTALYILLGP